MFKKISFLAGFRQFPCRFIQCCEAYTNVVDLHEHLRSAHNEMPYACECGEKFDMNASFVEHKKAKTCRMHNEMESATENDQVSLSINYFFHMQ